LRKIQGQDTEEQLHELDDQILDMSKPKSFQGKQSFEVRMIKNFEQSVIFLAQHMSRDPKSMTVLEFYQAMETITDQNKKQNKLNGQSHKGKRSVSG